MADEGATTYWHVQNLWVSEVEGTLLRGLSPSLAAQLTVPLRSVRDRIEYEDLARAPFAPLSPELHHRNETLTRLADVRVGLQWARLAPPWTFTASGGMSVPTGRTESNPFALGRLGVPHQHIQFGTGTVDPYATAVASRRAGAWSVTGSASARLSLVDNSLGHRAGNRFGATLSAARAVAGVWGVRAGVEFAREQAENWDGLVEEEGNLGRTDLFASFAGSRKLGFGTLGATVRVPLSSEVSGAQMDLPLVLQLSLSR